MGSTDPASGLNGSSAHGPLHVAFVLDRSGSMSPLTDGVVTGFDEYVSELRADGADTFLSLTLFDTSFEHVHVAMPLRDVPTLATTGYYPDGMTALYDAVAHTVLSTAERLDAQGKSDEKVLVVVMTDGMENSSTDYDARTFAELIRAYDDRPNWTFVYLGAGHLTLDDTQDAAAAMAFKKANAMRWSADSGSARKSMHSLSQATRERRAAHALKTDRLFADAGQKEDDYREETLPPRASRPSGASFARRNLRDIIDDLGAVKRDTGGAN